MKKDKKILNKFFTSFLDVIRNNKTLENNIYRVTKVLKNNSIMSYEIEFNFLDYIIKSEIYSNFGVICINTKQLNGIELKSTIDYIDYVFYKHLEEFTNYEKK